MVGWAGGLCGVGAELVGVYVAEEVGFNDGGVACCCHCGGCTWFQGCVCYRGDGWAEDCAEHEHACCLSGLFVDEDGLIDTVT